MSYFVTLVVLASIAAALAQQLYRLFSSGLLVNEREVMATSQLRATLGDYAAAAVQGLVFIISWGITALGLVIAIQVLPAIAPIMLGTFWLSFGLGATAVCQLWGASSGMLQKHGLRPMRSRKVGAYA